MNPLNIAPELLRAGFRLTYDQSQRTLLAQKESALYRFKSSRRNIVVHRWQIGQGWVKEQPYQEWAAAQQVTRFHNH